MSKNRTSNTRVEYYKSIDDLPLHNWIKCLAGEYQYSMVSPIDTFVEEDIIAWEKIYDAYINEFGLGMLYKQYLLKEVEIAKAKFDYVISRDKFNFNIIRVYESEIEQLKNKLNQGMTYESALIHLGKWYGGKLIRAKEITVREYCNLIKEYERAN